MTKKADAALAETLAAELSKYVDTISYEEAVREKNGDAIFGRSGEAMYRTVWLELPTAAGFSVFCGRDTEELRREGGEAVCRVLRRFDRICEHVWLNSSVKATDLYLKTEYGYGERREPGETAEEAPSMTLAQRREALARLFAALGE